MPLLPQPKVPDVSQSLSGIASVLEENRERDRTERKRDELKQEFMGAYQSNDPSQMAKFYAKYPAAGKAMTSALGHRNERTQAGYMQMQKDIMNNPAGARESIASHINFVQQQGGDPQQSMQYLQNIEQMQASGLPEDQINQQVSNTAAMDMASLDADYLEEFNRQRGVSAAGVPSNVKEWRHYSKLNPDEKVDYLDMKRQNYSIRDIGGVPHVVPKNSTLQPTPLSTLSDEATARLTTEKAGELGKLKARAELKPKVEAAVARAKGISSKEVSRLSAQADEGLAAADGMAVLNRGVRLLDDIETGGVDSLSLWVKQNLGIESEDEAELSNLMGKAVLSQLRTTFGAAFTAKEGDSLKTIEANYGKSPAGNRRLLKNALTIAERAAKRGIRAAKKIDDEDLVKEIEDAMSFELAGAREDQEVEAEYKEGLTATNPTTGEKMVFTDGEWQSTP